MSSYIWKKQVTVFLNVVDANTYALLRDLVSPAKPKDKPFKQLTTVLMKHYESTRIVIAKPWRSDTNNSIYVLFS